MIEYLETLIADPVAYIPALLVLSLAWATWGRDGDERITMGGMVIAASAISLLHGVLMLLLIEQSPTLFALN